MIFKSYKDLILNTYHLVFLQVRISQDTEHFLINPFGMLYNEITASGLVKVDMQGEVVEAGTTNFGVNVAGFMLHAAIHSARPDLKCVIHVHMPNIVAVSISSHWSQTHFDVAFDVAFDVKRSFCIMKSYFFKNSQMLLLKDVCSIMHAILSPFL